VLQSKAQEIGMSETIELKLAAGRLQTVKPCDICGECTDKEVSTFCEGWTSEGRHVLVCETCLKGGKELIELTLGNGIEFLRGLTGKLKIPTLPPSLAKK
jgi:hypothetical protein